MGGLIPSTTVGINAFGGLLPSTDPLKSTTWAYEQPEGEEGDLYGATRFLSHVEEAEALGMYTNVYRETDLCTCTCILIYLYTYIYVFVYANMCKYIDICTNIFINMNNIHIY